MFDVHLPPRVPEGADLEAHRELLVTAGVEVLERDGLGLAADALSYSRVFAHLEAVHGVSVARASVHERIWESHDHFRREVVAATVKHLPTDLLGDKAGEIRDVVISLYRRGLDTEARVTELCLWMAPVAFDLINSLDALPQVQLAKAIVTSNGRPLRADDLEGSLRDRGDSILAATRARMTELTVGLGLKARTDLVDSPTAHELLALISINCYVGGFLDLNAGSDDVRRPLAFRCLPADDPLPWTMVAIGMHSVVQLLFEPSDGEPGEAVPSVPDRPAPPVLDVGDPNRRRTRAELRDLVVAAGVEVLLQQRVDLRPETLSYASVLEHVERTRGVTLYRSSVHGRIWDSHKEYWLDVLARAIDAEPVIDRSIVADLAADAPPGAGDGPDGRWQRAMAEVRMLAAADTAARLASTDFLRRQSIRSALLMEPDSEPFSSLRRLLHRSQTTEIARLKDFYRQVVSLGFEVRPELGIDDEEALRILATLYLSAASGAVFDQAAGVESSSRTYTLRPAGEHGRHRQWPAISVATWAVFAYLFQVADP